MWVTTGAFSGAGTVEARGGDGAYYGVGGGGAIAIEYTTATGSVLSNLVARTGNSSNTNRYGGAGTVYLKGGTSTYGDVIIDNKGVVIQQPTELPSLGSGIAQAGTTGATLVTDRAVNIPAYFAGNWVEIRDAANVLKGTCRISTAAGGIVAKTVTLVSCSPAVTLAVGDKWQGVYRFDTMTLSGVRMLSVDPVRVTNAEVKGTVEVRRIDTTNLTVRTAGNLTQIPTTDPLAPESVVVNATGAVTLETGAVIDVSGRGYPVNKSYPGATTPGDATGGSHLGYGGLNSNPLGSTFGSVYRPQEAGGGAGNGSPRAAGS